MTCAENINFSLPSGSVGPDQTVFVKIAPIKKKPDTTVTPYRSFRLPCAQNYLVVSVHKRIPLSVLYNLLVDHGLSKTVPQSVTLDSNVEFFAFDWAPMGGRGNQQEWHFDWNGTDCSIVGMGSGCSQEWYHYKLAIRVYDTTPGVGEQILSEISCELMIRHKEPATAPKSLQILTAQRTINGFEWKVHSTRLHRSLQTIYINESVKNNLIQQLSNFYASADLYDQYGVTWKRVHLFHGVPGSGKTSTILALASYFRQNIAKLTVTPDLDSRAIESLFNTLPVGTFMVLEDADALFTERTAATSIDFSTMLQCMDGLTTRRGLVLFMTTNYLSRIDQAFVRPGRVDCCVEFSLPAEPELRLALQSLAPQYSAEHTEYLRQNPKISIAAMQKHLFECAMGKCKSILF